MTKSIHTPDITATKGSFISDVLVSEKAEISPPQLQHFKILSHLSQTQNHETYANFG